MQKFSEIGKIVENLINAAISPSPPEEDKKEKTKLTTHGKRMNNTLAKPPFRSQTFNLQRALTTYTATSSERFSSNIRRKKESADMPGYASEDSVSESSSEIDAVSVDKQLAAVKKYFSQMEGSGVTYATTKALVSSNDQDLSSLKEHEGKIIHYGHLSIQGTSPQSWQEYFFILRKTGLTYFLKKYKRRVLKYIEVEPSVAETQAFEGEEDDLIDFSRDDAYSAVTRTNSVFQKTERLGTLMRDPPKAAKTEPVNKRGQRKKRKIETKAQGQLYFVELATPTGHVVDDLSLSKFPSSMLGNRKNCFLMQTDKKMFVLNSRSEDEKLDWLTAIDKTYNVFVKKLVHKVAIMELSWSFADEISRVGSFASKRGNQGGVKEKKIMNKIVKKTLERAKKRINTTNVSREKAGEEEEMRRIKRQIKKVNKNARGSLSRMEKAQKLRISAKRGNDVYEEAMQGLSDKYVEELRKKQARLLQVKAFKAWRLYASVAKLGVQ
eukprot:augustus_masked-scaffold_53-processed-gene-0.2-mRNA-1 protein AED:1.00 eAED:1.00 QI:0/-1/0/0/-1/1/1/0/494